jgi:hypothetical protein
MGNFKPAACVSYLTMLSVAQASEASNDKAINKKIMIEKGVEGSIRGIRTAVYLQLRAKTEENHEVQVRIFSGTAVSNLEPPEQKSILRTVLEFGTIR